MDSGGMGSGGMGSGGISVVRSFDGKCRRRRRRLEWHHLQPKIGFIDKLSLKKGSAEAQGQGRPWRSDGCLPVCNRFSVDKIYQFWVRHA
jgi:hypothetical protein